MTQSTSTDERTPLSTDAHAMHCPILGPCVERIWPALLEFRAWRLGHPSNDLPPFVLCYRNGPGAHAPWQFAAGVRHLSKHRLHDAVVVPLHDSRQQVARAALRALPGCERLTFFDGLGASEGAPVWMVLRGGHLPGGVLAAYRLYLPFLLGQHRAMLRARPWVSAHLAQTLDARIATLDGHSKWISNEANRVHAHRLRALHDAVLVGRMTVERDDPRLTVRAVRGTSPVRVVLDRDCRLLSANRSYRIFSETGRSFVLHAERLDAARDHGTAQPDVVTLALKETLRASGEAILHPRAILEAMWSAGARSVFIEGGGRTLSHFLSARRVDLLHLHIAPMLLGSGVASIGLPPVARIENGIFFHMRHFYLDGEILLECIPRLASC